MGVCPLQCSVRCVHRGQQHVTASHMTLSGTRERAALQSYPPSLPPLLPLPLQLHPSLFPVAFLLSFNTCIFFLDQICFLQMSPFLHFILSPIQSLLNFFLPIPCFSVHSLFLYSSFLLTLCALLIPAVDLSKINSSEYTKKQHQLKKKPAIM